MSVESRFSSENVLMSVCGHLALIAIMLTSFALVVDRAKLVAPDRVEILEIDLNAVRVGGDETVLHNVNADAEPDATPEETDLMTAVCKRRMLKPKDTFKEVLNHTAGRNGYDDVDLMIGKLARYLKFDGKITIKTAINKISDFVDEILAEKDNLVF